VSSAKAVAASIKCERPTTGPTVLIVLLMLQGEKVNQQAQIVLGRDGTAINERA
jgi:hypothetical protein